MRTRLLICLLVLPLSLWACGRTEFLEPRTSSLASDGSEPAGPDAYVVDRFDAGRDGGTPIHDAGIPRPDGGAPAWDAGSCRQAAPWKIEARRTLSAKLGAPSSASPRIGSSVQLVVEVQLLSACEEFARVEVVLMPGNATDFVSLNAYAWVQQMDGCEPVAPVVKTAVLVPGRGTGNPNVVVSDGQSPSSQPLLTYSIGLCSSPVCQCLWWQPPGPAQEGEVCATDCDCAADLACLPGLAPGGVFWSCLRPCTKQTDCPQSGCRFDGAPAYVCDSRDACPLPDDCPAGFSCVIRDSPSFCQDERVAPLSTPCQCDAECLPGHRCLVGFREQPTCEIPCADNQDCPFTWLVCGTPAFCVPLSK